MRVLVAGAEGQVGRALMAAAPRGLRLRATGRETFDLTRPARMRALLDAERPDLVVNCAAYTAVDLAESETELALAVNRDGPAELAAALAERGIPLIHLSTDYVFAGDRSGAYREDDATGPINAYGAGKLAGEAAVAERLDRHVILRTSWVYGSGGGNFVRTMLRLARERDEVRVVDDQRGCPTAASHIAEVVIEVAGAIASGMGDRWGLYHYRDDEILTWYGFAERIFATAAPMLGHIPRLVAIASEDFPAAARRPANSVLDCDRIGAAFGIAPKSLATGLARHVEDILEATAA